MYRKVSCYILSTTLLLVLFEVLPSNSRKLNKEDDPCCVALEESPDHFTCEGSCQFPVFSKDATDVRVIGGHFSDIKSNHFPETVQNIVISGSTIEDIHSFAFHFLHHLVHIKFYDTQIDTINDEAFTYLEFKSPTVSIVSEARPSLIFKQCTLIEVDGDAFYNIQGLEFLQFIDTDLRSADSDAFKEVNMLEGLIEVIRVNVFDGDDFPDLDDIRGVTETRIQNLEQNKLSRSLLSWSGRKHTMENSGFVDIDEDLSERSYDENGLNWHQIDIYCGEDIEWLMEDRSSIPEEMLSSLYCNGPQNLVGQMVSALDEDEWRDEVFSEDSMSTIVIIVIIVCVIVVILLIIGLVIYCKKKQRKPAPDGAPAIRSQVATVSTVKIGTMDTDPPPYDNPVGGAYAHSYDNPSAPPYDNPSGSTVYDNTSGTAAASNTYDNQKVSLNTEKGHAKYDNPIGAHAMSTDGPQGSRNYDNTSDMNPGYAPEAPTYESIYVNPDDDVITTAGNVTYDNGQVTVSAPPEGVVYDNK